jgi:hypothetical protein
MGGCRRSRGVCAARPISLLALRAAGSRFFAASFLQESGRGSDIDFGYLIFQYTV